LLFNISLQSYGFYIFIVKKLHVTHAANIMLFPYFCLFRIDKMKSNAREM